MKFLITLLGLLAVILAFADAKPKYSAADRAYSCRTQHHGFYKAITKFCNNDGIVIPSGYGDQGKNNNGHLVQITGNCFPAQWVPKGICQWQFYTMCATSNKGGAKRKRFGRGKCQHWSLFKFQ